MTRSFRVLYIALFLLVLLALGAWSLRSFFGFNTNADATVLNGRWSKAVETHYDDQFPIKRIGTNLWAALDYKLFNEGRPGVVLGRDHWLYSDEEFNPAVNEDQNLEGNYALVEGVRQQLKDQGIQLVMAIVPAKVRLYPEHLGEVKPASIHANLYQDFAKALLASQRPKKLSKLELEQYNELLEEQADPYVEKAIALHGVNAHRASEGFYDEWVQKSFVALKTLQPARYNKTEHSEATVDAIR